VDKIVTIAAKSPDGHEERSRSHLARIIVKRGDLSFHLPGQADILNALN
jgi:hypothetical protein